MTVRWTVRAATDRGPQAEIRVLFGAPKKKHSRKSVGVFLLLSDTLLRLLSPCFGRSVAAVNRLGCRRFLRKIQAAPEQEETQSSAKRSKRAMRQCC